MIVFLVKKRYLLFLHENILMGTYLSKKLVMGTTMYVFMEKYEK